LELGRRFPNRNFIGQDIKADRLCVAGQQAANQNLPNVAFIESSALNLTSIFGSGEISRLIIPFPDPFETTSKAKHHAKRLTADAFLRIYHQVVAPDGMITLRTDSRIFFDYSIPTILAMGMTIYFQTPDLQSLSEDERLELARIFPEIEVSTIFYRKAVQVGKAITFIAFR
jgi:tRNA (guanine-N7-)-methyltransferase